MTAGSVDPRWPCIVGVGQHTWHREDTGEAGAPEPLEMWERVARDAADDALVGGRLLERLDAIELTYCQTGQYDDPVARLCDRLGVSPRRCLYSGIGGTTPQVLVQEAAARILRGDLDVALVVGAEALATQAACRKRGEPYVASFPPERKRPYPWEAPFLPAETAHDVFHAWLAFAIFDNARRAHLGLGLDEYRWCIGEMMAPMTAIAARNPNAWFRVARTPDDIVVARPENRMIAYPYTKYMTSVMDVDMGAAVIVASHEQADALGVPADRRVYLRGWCEAADPTYVAEHTELWRSPAMVAASAEALRVAGVGVDDVAHFDLYSCFPSSLHFARDALGLARADPRPLTVTGGLPYHGGPASNYLAHAIATMAQVLRADPGSFGVVSGVGMLLTKHVFGVYSTAPGPVVLPDRAGVRARLGAEPRPVIVDGYEGAATVAAYSVVHGRGGEPEWGVAVCDVDGMGGRARTYAKLLDADLLASAESTELVGRRLVLTSETITLPTGGEGRRNVAREV